MGNFEYTTVPVAIVFFNRADTLKFVFDAVRAAKPQKLFLIQDGPRPGRSEERQKVEECRRVVENVDWPCEVVRDYSEVNLGCGARVSSGISNAFKTVDRLMILEDDCVPSLGMFSFCEEVLEKYKDDTRINMISGMNHLGKIDISDGDYLFCKTGAIWGWATWKRVWDTYEFSMPYFSEKRTMELFSHLRLPKYYIESMNRTGSARQVALCNGEKLSAWTYQFAMVRHLYSQLVIVPDRNLISNIGVTEDATHGSGSLRVLPKGIQRVFFMKTYNYENAIKHPKYIIEDTCYDEQVRKILGQSKLQNKWRMIEGIFRKIVFGEKKDKKRMFDKLRKKIHH